MGESVIVRSFAAGELDPGLGVRADLQAYQQGLRLCRNFLVRRSGGVVSRPGLAHVADPKRPESKCFLFAFLHPTADENYLVEAGDNYFRFHHHERGMVLELETTYNEGTLEGSSPLDWEQHGLVVTLTHGNWPPMELAYVGPDEFTLTAITLDDPTLELPPVPGSPSLDTISGFTLDDGAYFQRWFVTAVNADEVEGPPKPFADYTVPTGPQVFAIEPTPALPTTLEWTAVTDAVEYRIYKNKNQGEDYYWIGSATGLEFDDVGQALGALYKPYVPPTFTTVMDLTTEVPTINTMHKQRRIFASPFLPFAKRDRFWASRIGDTNNFTSRSPLQDDDAFTWRTVSRDLQVPIAMVSLGPLVVLTDRGEWVLRGDEDRSLTPFAINPEQLGYVGSAYVRPAMYGERLLFVQAREAAVRELRFDVQVEGLSGRDLSVGAAHLFRGQRIIRLAFALLPDAILWAVRQDGRLLGCTYIPDLDVIAWHQHETHEGRFESIEVLPEVTEDAVYVVVERDGIRTIERLGVRDTALGVRQAVLDSSVRLPVTGRSALEALPQRLRGRELRLVLDGVPMPGIVMADADGTLVLPMPADVVDVGIPIYADLESLALDTVGSPVRDQVKKVTALAILVEDSLQNFSAGPDFDHLLAVRAAQWEDPDARLTGRIELTPTAYFHHDAHVCLRHTEPSTLTILGLIPVFDVGG